MPLIVPVLRAGLGMLDAAFTMLPNAEVGFVGLRRHEETHDSEEYMTTVPDDLHGRPVIVLDPMLATGGSLVHTVEIIERSNPGAIIVVCVLAAPEGIAHFAERCPDARVVTATSTSASTTSPSSSPASATRATASSGCSSRLTLSGEPNGSGDGCASPAARSVDQNAVSRRGRGRGRR